MTLCGGEPTVSVTVKVTLWWKEILLVGFSLFGTKPCGSVWVLRGNMRATQPASFPRLAAVGAPPPFSPNSAGDASWRWARF